MTRLSVDYYSKSVNVSLKYAEEHLADLISAADRGEEVEITRPEKPALKLVVSSTSSGSARKADKRILGAGRGELRVPTFEEWQAMDADLETESPDRPLMTSGEV